MADLSSKVQVDVLTTSDNKGIDEAEKRIGMFSKSALDAHKALTVGILGAGAAVGAFGVASIKAAADMEQQEVAFKTLLKDGKKATEFLAQLRKDAAATPFEFTDLTSASRKLIAFGFDATKSRDMLMTLGDAASGLGLGAAGLDRMTTAIGQMQAKGKVSAQEMMQLAEAGVPAWEMLAQKLGTSIPEAMKLAEKGVVDSQTGINAVLEGMNTRFAGGMKAQSTTINGLMSTMKDTVNFAMVDVGNAFIKAFNLNEVIEKQVIPGIQKFADFMTGTVIPFLENNKGLFVGLGVMIATIVVPAFVAWAIAAGSAAVATLIALGPITLAILAITAVVTALYLAWNNNFLGIRDIVQSVVDWFTNVAMPAISAFFTGIMNWVNSMGGWFNVLKNIVLLVLGTIITGGLLPFVLLWIQNWDKIKAFFGTIMTAISNTWNNTWTGIKNFVTDIWNSITGFIKGKINEIIDMINGMIRGFNSVSGKITGNKVTIGEIPKFANGVTDFAGGMAIVGERGPELVNLPRGSNVIPNNQLAGTGVTINQTNYIREPFDMEQAYRELGWRLSLT